MTRFSRSRNTDGGNDRSGRTRLRELRHGAAPAAKTLLFRSGLLEVVRELRPSRHVAILRYHAICEPSAAGYCDPSICVTPAAFAGHIAYLARNYAVLPLPEVVTRMQARRPFPPNAVAITFDDGYADNLEAARTLHRSGASATFYITAGCVRGGEPFWPAEIRALLPRIQATQVALQAGARLVCVPLETAADRRAAIGTVTRLFKSHSIPERERMREQLRMLAGASGLPSPMLTWDDLAEMQRLGMTIGAHTMTHPNLPSAGLADATREIVDAKKRLERELGKQVTTFSYPNGGAERYYTPDLQQVVREAGFLAAASSRNGFASLDSDLYALERIQVAERLEDLAFALEVERFAFKPRPKQSYVGA